jgi:hypothetical protein
MHFDLAEIYARQLREEFNKLRIPCGNEKRTQDALDRLHKEKLKELVAEEATYDRESNHGLDFAKQKEWEDSVKESLSREGPPNALLQCSKLAKSLLGEPLPALERNCVVRRTKEVEMYVWSESHKNGYPYRNGNCDLTFSNGLQPLESKSKYNQRN